MKKARRSKPQGDRDSRKSKAPRHGDEGASDAEFLITEATRKLNRVYDR